MWCSIISDDNGSMLLGVILQFVVVTCHPDVFGCHKRLWDVNSYQ